MVATATIVVNVLRVMNNLLRQVHVELNRLDIYSVYFCSDVFASAHVPIVKIHAYHRA
jgi:hypothetical protein